MAANINSVAGGGSFSAGTGFTDSTKTDVSDKQTLLAVLQFLKKNNLKGTEELLKREAGINEADVKPEATTQSESDVSHALAAYKSDDDPTLYDDHYTDFKAFIESCLDVHKVELSMILYPVFVHMYLELVYNGHERQAKEFFWKYSLDQEEYYHEDLNKLSTVTKQEHMRGNQLMDNFKSSKFVLKMSRDSYTHLKRYLQEKKMNLLLNIIQEHLFIDVFDGIPRTKQQIDTSSGGMLGEAAREANKVKIFHGLLKEPDLNIPADDDDDGGGDGEDKPKLHYTFVAGIFFIYSVTLIRNIFCPEYSYKMITRNIIFLSFLYFLQGLPYGLQSRFLPLYFRTHGMSLSEIGFFKLLLIPWMLKAIWAPFVDRYSTKKVWLSTSMFGLFLTCLLGAFTTPEVVLKLAGVLLLFNFLTATQDIAVDGLAIQILAASELAAGNIAQVVGYKFGALFSGGLLTWLSEILKLSWGTLFLGLSLLYITACVVIVKVIPSKYESSVRYSNDSETENDKDDISKDKNCMLEAKVGCHGNTSLERNWIVEHFRQILSTDDAGATRWTLLYVLVYKLGEQGSLTMLPMFMVDQGMSAASVGFWTGMVGVGVSIFGSVLGGWLVAFFRYTPYQVVLFFSKCRLVPLVLYALLIGSWVYEVIDVDHQTVYVVLVLCMSLMLLGSGVVTTTTFTLMMYCSQRSPSSIQKKKQKKDSLMMRKSKNDPNSPATTRIPLPELKDLDKMEKINAYREALKRVKMGANSLPSICFYTLQNALQGVTSAEISEDSSLMSTGFGDSTLRIWTLTPSKLRALKPVNELELIEKEADDVLERMMDDRTAEDNKTLLGHSGPVYSASFSPDRNYLTSCSEDGTVRLWSLHTWTNLVSYKGHNSPVWDVKFSPHGHYFVSCGHDRVARLWTTDHYQPVRVFAGHHSDVDCVQFHPNGNYVATGSSDRMVRVYDILNGGCVRVLTGHKGAVHSLNFSPDGKYLASSGLDGSVILWDISTGNMVAQMKDHKAPVYSLCFSRCGSVLTSGGLDHCVKLWDISKVMKELDKDMDASIPSSLSVNENPNLLIGSFQTKATSVLTIHFTRKNLLLAAGPIKVS